MTESNVVVISKNEIKEAEKIRDMFAVAFGNIHEICLYYVEAIDKNPKIKDACLDLGISGGFLRKAENVGRGQLHYKLLLNSGSGYNKLSKCQISEQKKYYKVPIDVLCANGDVLKVEVSKLGSAQSKQVFAYDHVRDVAEQRSYIEEEKLRSVKATKPKTSPYRITKGGLYVQEGNITITKNELLSILSDM